jgi:hypothetical protein
MKRIRKISLLSVATATGLTAISANAAPPNPFYANGDLVIFFQKPGDSDTVYASLGNAATLYRGAAAGPDVANNVDFLDLNSVLISAFGEGWADDPDIYAGLAGVNDSSVTSNALTNLDPARTLYISSPRNSVGTVGTPDSVGWDLTLAGNTAMTGASTGIQTQNNIFENNYDVQAVVSPTGLSQIDEQNPFIAPGIQGNAFSDALEGGVQQVGSSTGFGTFGAAGPVEFALDLYRVLAKNTISGQVAGALRVGSYEGTITVSSVGKVSFISQGAGPASFYDSWLTGFFALDTPTDKLPETDFDNDGYTNLEEFVLNGNPAVSGQAIAPTLSASGLNFVFNFTRRADSVTEVTQIFEYSTNLVDWTTKTPISIPTTPGTVGFVTVGANSGTAPNELQAVTLTIPKGSDTKLFGRLKVVK